MELSVLLSSVVIGIIFIPIPPDPFPPEEPKPAVIQVVEVPMDIKP